MKGLVLVAALAVTGNALAAMSAIAIKDGETTVIVDPYSKNGDFSWVVYGHEVLNKQWFWYRANDMGFELPVDTITEKSAKRIGDSGVKTTYWADSFMIQIEQTVNGELILGTNLGDIVSQMDVAITITNYDFADAPLEFNLFQYCDMQLGSIFDNLEVYLLDDNGVQVRQSGQSIFGGENASVRATLIPVTTSIAAGTDGSLLDELTDFAVTNLDDFNGGPINEAFAEGNVQWVIQWSFTLQPGESVTIDKNLFIAVPDAHAFIPEPVTMSLLALGGLALLRRRK